MACKCNNGKCTKSLNKNWDVIPVGDWTTKEYLYVIEQVYSVDPELNSKVEVFFDEKEAISELEKAIREELASVEDNISNQKCDVARFRHLKQLVLDCLDSKQDLFGLGDYQYCKIALGHFNCIGEELPGTDISFIKLWELPYKDKAKEMFKFIVDKSLQGKHIKGLAKVKQ